MPLTQNVWPELCCLKILQGAQAFVEVLLRQAPFAVEPPQKIFGRVPSFLRVASHAAGNQVAVRIAPATGQASGVDNKSTRHLRARGWPGAGRPSAGNPPLQDWFRRAACLRLHGVARMCHRLRFGGRAARAPPSATAPPPGGRCCCVRSIAKLLCPAAGAPPLAPVRRKGRGGGQSRESKTAAVASLGQELRGPVVAATSMIGLGSARIVRTKTSTMEPSNCAFAQRSSSARASVALRAFL